MTDVDVLATGRQRHSEYAGRSPEDRPLPPAAPPRRPPLPHLMLAAWVLFAAVNLGLMVILVGKETIPYHLIWASYALLYGLVPLSRRVMVVTFLAVTVLTALPLVAHAHTGDISWFECSETVLMATVVGLLVWHVNRHRVAQRRIVDLLQDERTEAERRELTARFGSHEVRTRLTVARALLQVMSDESGDPAVHADAALVLGEIDKATATVTTLLHLVRADAPGESRPIDLDCVVEESVARWSTTVDREWSSSSFVGPIVSDPERLEAALDCLIENAVRFTRSTDSIAVDARVERNELVLSVADSGLGIPEADRQRVFLAFETGSAAKELGLTGLGLALVRALVESRAGTLAVTSELGQGSCFTIRLPLVRPPAALRGARTASPGRSTS